MSWLPSPSIGAFLIILFIPMVVGFFAGFGVGSMLGFTGMSQWATGAAGLIVAAVRKRYGPDWD